MRINSSDIGMESARKATSSTRKSMSFASVTKNAAIGGKALAGAFEESISGSRQQKSINYGMFGMKQQFKGVAKSSSIGRSEMEETLQSMKVSCMSYLLALLRGARNGNKFGPSETESKQPEKEGNTEQPSNPTDSANIVTKTLSLTESYYHEETEEVSFSTTGTVVTADGKEISFNLEMQMSRSFSEYYETNTILHQVSYCDPLVINLGSNVASVSDQKFMFDIDSDGILDSISELSSPSGYLALDLNEDGIINDGSELFGTKSGDGFKDLSKYDSDQNGWIDENDEIWKKLMIWSKDEDGKDQLYHLTEKGVGAIALQNVSTSFSLNSAEDNHVNARVRNTGIFLYENGGVGSVQHLDLAR